jgi:hypothetical protein
MEGRKTESEQEGHKNLHVEELDWPISPAILKGDSSLPYLRSYWNDVRENFGGNPYLHKIKATGGSSNLIVTIIDSRHYYGGDGIRAATLADVITPEIFDKYLSNKVCVDIPALVVQSEKGSSPSEDQLMKDLLPLVEENQGKVEYPFIATGYDFEHAPERLKNNKHDPNYIGHTHGLKLIARSDFKIVHDERLAKYSGKFNYVNKEGIPIFEKDGRFGWRAGKEGLSGLRMNQRGCIEVEDCLRTSYEWDDHRVVLIRGNTDENFLDNLVKNYDQELNDLEGRYSDSQEILQKTNDYEKYIEARDILRNRGSKKEKTKGEVDNGN